jgi:hypothetical protein
MGRPTVAPSPPANREEPTASARPVDMSEHEHEDAERTDDEDVEAHAAPAPDESDDADDVDAHLFQRR